MGAPEKVRELRAALAGMHGNLEEPRAGEKGAVLEKGEAAAAKGGEMGGLVDDNSGMRRELAATMAVLGL